MMGIGNSEIGVLLMFFAGFGLPLGLPPEPENPAMSFVAPDKVLLYASWSGMAQADPKSPNQTEQLLAEPEVREFAAAIEKTLTTLLARNTPRDEIGETLRKIAPLGVRTVISRATAIYITKVQPKGEGLELEGGVLLNGGEDAPKLAEGLARLLAPLGAKAAAITIGAGKFTRITPNGQSLHSPITLGTLGPYVLIGMGDGAVEGMIARVRAKKSPDWLTAIREHLPVERRASISYVDIHGLVNTFLPMAGPDAGRYAQALGVGNLGVLEGTTGLDKEGMVTRSLLTLNGPPRGLIKLLDGEGVKPAQLRGIPGDSLFAAAFTFNSGRLYDLIFELMAENAPGEEVGMKRAADQFQQQFGVALREELLTALGDTWTLHSSPADGWFVGVTASVAVTNRERLDAFAFKFQEMIRNLSSDAPPGHPVPHIRATKHGPHLIYTYSAPRTPVQPSWCITNDRVIAGLFPQAVKASLDLRPEEQRLTDRPEWGELLKTRDPILSVGYQDTAKTFEIMYTYAAMLNVVLRDMGGNNGFPPDEDEAAPSEGLELPSGRSIHRHLRPMVSVVRRTKAGIESESHQTVPTLDIGTTAPIAVALLLPAVQAARTAAARIESTNNLKQIMLGIHNFHDTHNGFPPAYIPDKTGKPGLSWRVAILPYIEQSNLYNEFKQDEPWDSEHNKKLIARMPKVYMCPSANPGPGKTVYLGIAGKQGVFQPPKIVMGNVWKPGNTFAFVTDGTSNTAAVIEASNAAAVIWTKPDDIIPDEKNPLGIVADYNKGNIFMMGLCDGSVRAVSRSIDPKMLLRLFYANDGETVQIP